jgi:hypothetical protein
MIPGLFNCMTYIASKGGVTADKLQGVKKKAVVACSKILAGVTVELLENSLSSYPDLRTIFKPGTS